MHEERRHFALDISWGLNKNNSNCVVVFFFFYIWPSSPSESLCHTSNIQPRMRGGQQKAVMASWPPKLLSWRLELFLPVPAPLAFHGVMWLLLSCFSRDRLCATPQMAAHQAPPSLGFSRQEHWSGLSFPFPMHESEKWKWSCSVVSVSSPPHGLQPTRLLLPWDFPGKSTGMGCHCLLQTKA